jgi:hypothetical protein
MVLVLSPLSVCSTLLSSLGAGMATRRRCGHAERVRRKRRRAKSSPILAACRQRSPAADGVAHLAVGGGDRRQRAGAPADARNGRRAKAQRRAKHSTANGESTRPAGHGLRGHERCAPHGRRSSPLYSRL